MTIPYADIDLDTLAKHYTADEVPPCGVCGGELTIQRMGGGEPTAWAHAAPDGVTYADWRQHYAESRWIQYRGGDGEVLAIIARLRATDDVLAQLTALAQGQTTVAGEDLRGILGLLDTTNA
jgi:hypothetical protein